MTQRFVSIVLGLLLTALAASAQSKVAHARPAAASTPPADFSGVWERYPDPYAGGVDYPPPPGGTPQLKEPYASTYKTFVQKRDESLEAGKPLIDASTRCLPEGMPTLMGAVYDVEILHRTGETVVLAEFLSQIRRVFINEKMPPVEEISPSYNGFSVGHWEGATLVVHTAGVREDVLFFNMPHSKDMRITERIRLQSPDSLEDRITIEDPQILAKPYQFTFGYRRDRGYKVVEYICDNNRYRTGEHGDATLKVQP